MIKYLEKNKSLSIILLILITIEIFYFSSIPGTIDTGTGGSSWIPRAYHAIVFFLFAFFLIATIKGNKKLKPNHILITITISIINALLDEAHQAFVPFRHPGFTDILTDSLGIFSAILIYIFINKKSQKIHKVSKEHFESLKQSLSSPPRQV